jgi:hypothetical protein
MFWCQLIDIIQRLFYFETVYFLTTGLFRKRESAVMTDEASHLTITVDKSHILSLGERLYEQSIELIRELVNNAYDADATRVEVTVSGNTSMSVLMKSSSIPYPRVSSATGSGSSASANSRAWPLHRALK